MRKFTFTWSNISISIDCSDIGLENCLGIADQIDAIRLGYCDD